MPRRPYFAGIFPYIGLIYCKHYIWPLNSGTFPSTLLMFRKFTENSLNLVGG